MTRTDSNAAPAQRIEENAAYQNLRQNQRQLDMDGCEVGVSRQALEEVLDAFAAALSPSAPAEIEGLLDALLTVVDENAVDSYRADQWPYEATDKAWYLSFDKVVAARTALLDAIARLTPPAKTHPVVPKNESLRPGIEAAKNVIRRTFTRAPEVVSELVARFDLCLSRTLTTPYSAPETTDGLTRATECVLSVWRNDRHNDVAMAHAMDALRGALAAETNMPEDLRPGLAEAIRIVEESKAYTIKRQSLFPFDSPTAGTWRSKEAEASEIIVALGAAYAAHGRAALAAEGERT